MIAYRLAAFFTAFTLGACGGSGSGELPSSVMPAGPSETEPSEPTEGPAGDEPLNASLTGSLIVDEDEIDLVTGRRRVLENIGGDSRGYTRISGSPDGRFYVNAHDLDCFRIIDQCVKIYYPGAFTREFIVDFRLEFNPPSVSPDGSMVVVGGSNDIGEPFQLFVLSIPEGVPGRALRGPANVVASREFGRRSAWALDGSLYYTRAGSVYHAASILQPQDEDRIVWTWDDRVNGFPQSLSVNPDGSQVVVERVEGSSSERSEQGIWIVQSDGSGARSFVTSDPINQARWPVWSPDGRWIVASVAGQSTGLEFGAGTDVPLANRLFAFDASVANHELGGEILEDTSTRFRLRAYCFQNESSCAEDSRPVLVGGGETTLWRP